jgi:hypothetical protein
MFEAFLSEVVFVSKKLKSCPSEVTLFFFLQ